MIAFGVVSLTATTTINIITQGIVVSTILFGAIEYKKIPKPLKFK